MQFSSPLSLPLLFLLLATTVTVSTADSSAVAPSRLNISIYDVLPKYGLPPGIIPNWIEIFSLTEDGALIVSLIEPCYVHFDYLVYYGPIITGFLRNGSLSGISGIQMNFLYYFWFNVDSITVDLPPTDYIYFHWGWFTTSLRVDQFSTIPTCHLSRSIHKAFQRAKDLFTNLSW